MNRVALYARVSDKGKQGDNASIPTQLEAMRQYATSQNWHVAYELVEMDSASEYGEGLERPKIREALQLSKHRKIDIFMFYDVDRFTRSMGDGVILRREFRKENVRLFKCKPSPEEITSDNEIINILRDYGSQDYVERMRLKAIEAYETTIKQGIPGKRSCPFGYEIIGRKLEKKPIIIEEQAAIVRTIFDMFVHENLSTTQIATRLTELQIRTPGEFKNIKVRKRGSCEWTRQAVGSILKEEAYAGTWYNHQFKGIGKNKKERRDISEHKPIPMPPIIEKHIWELAQERMKERDYIRQQQYTHRYTYLLSQRARCGKCQTRMYGASRTRYGTRHYYYCGSADTAKGKCGSPYFRAEKIDSMVWDFLKELMQDPQSILESYQEAQQHQNDQLQRVHQQIALVNQEIADNTEYLNATLDQRKTAKARVLIDALDRNAEKYAEALEDLQRKKEQLTAKFQKQGLTDQHIQAIVEFVADMQEEVLVIDATDDVAAKRALVEALNLRFTLRHDEADQQWVDIHWLLKTASKPVSKLQSHVRS